PLQRGKGNLAHGGGLQRDRCAGVGLSADRIQTDELARQVKSCNMLVAAGKYCEGLERAGPYRIDRVELAAGMEQCLASFDGPPTQDDAIQLIDVLFFERVRQTQSGKTATAAIIAGLA